MIRSFIKEIILESMGRLPFEKIYCDMDGVLVDFQSGIVEKINYMIDNPGQYSNSNSYRKAIKRISKDFGPNWRVPKDFYTKSHKGVAALQFKAVGEDPGTFFRNLLPLSDGLGELWPFINSLGVQVNILSAPISGRGPGGTADDGKRDWIKNHRLFPHETIIVPAVEKQNWAVGESGRPNLIIDDKLRTIEQWESRGGIGIHHLPGKSNLSIGKIKEILS